MTKLILTLMIALCASSVLSAQSVSTYHVNVKTLNLRSTAATDAKIVKQLGKYDNVTLLESLEEKEWIKVRYKEWEGYVVVSSLAKGEAVVTVQSIRVGAICKDGTSSKATGRGACSHHGGVKEWKYESKKSVSIINNQ